MIRALFVFFAVVIAVSIAGGARANESTLSTPMIVGGGTPFGYYFGLAGSICAAVNRTTDTGIRCLTVSNDGSAQNIADVDSGKIDFAIVQSDWLYHAANGTSRYRSTGANDELRSVVAVPSEALTILARRSIGAKILTHLGGRRIGYGAPNNYAYLLMRAAVEAARISLSSENVEDGRAIDKICAGDIDVYVTVERHLNAGIAGLMSKCDLNLVALDRSTIETVTSKRPDFAAYEIPSGSYAEAQPAISTFGLQAILIAQSSAPDQKVTEVLGALFGPGSEGSQNHPPIRPPAAKHIEWLKEVAPLHRAASDFYKNKGWAK